MKPNLQTELLDRFPVELVVLNAEFQFLYVSPRAVGDHELREWLIGRTDFDYCEYRQRSPALAQRRIKRLIAVRDNVTRVVFEEVLEIPGGTRRYQRTLVPVTSLEGRVVYIVGFGEALVENDEADEVAGPEQSRDAVYISTPDGRLLELDRFGRTLLEIGQTDDLGTIEIVRDTYVDPWDRECLRRSLDRHGSISGFEIRLKTQRGRHLVVQTTASALRDDEGRVIAHLGTMRDVTVHRRLEHQRRESQKMEAVGRVARGLSHDFNNLLTAVNGYSDLLLQQLEDKDPKRAYVEHIRTAGQRAALLIAQLGTLSRRTVTANVTMDLNVMIRHQEALLHDVVAEDIELALQLDTELDRVEADPAQAEQVLLNLALNAREAMPSGGRLTIETRNITLGAADGAPLGLTAGSYVGLLISDTGIGIGPGVREHMFEPFFTTKESGSGLGLSMVYGFVQQSDGRIDVESAKDGGTTFRIYLPAAQDTTESPNLIWTKELAEPTVLVVEDEATVRDLLADLLQEARFRVLTAVDADDALALLENRERPIDLLVSDVVLPGISGPELADRLAVRFPTMRTLFVSGYETRFQSQHGIDLQEHKVMRKPFTPAAFLRAIHELLSNPIEAVTPS